MKIRLMIFAILATKALPAFSQSGTAVERAFACSLINGYTIQDAVDVMRSFEWSEDFAPRFVALREAAYGSDEFRDNWDFVVSLYYTSMVELSEKRLAFRSRDGGSEGYNLRDVAQCDNAPRINSVDFFPGQGSGGDAPEFTAVMTTSCERNLEVPLSTVASTVTNLMGSNLRGVQIINRQFGGPTQAMGSRFGIRAVFNSPGGFSESMDALRSNQPQQIPPCNVPSAWLQYRIYDRGN